MEVGLHTFLILEIHGGKKLSSHLCHFTPAKKNPWYRMDGGWMGFGIGLDSAEKQKNCFPLTGIKPSVLMPVAPASGIFQNIGILFFLGKHRCKDIAYVFFMYE
jgi:hypothetical protein